MPWNTRTLKDGRKIPEIAWGSWKVDNNTCAEQVEQAYETGFDHFDTAQIYRNETEVGQGLKQSGDRSSYWLTSKWSGLDGKGPNKSIQESLDYLDTDALDLYLIHSPRLTRGNTPGYWREMEKIQQAGLSKSIGVSNFRVSDLEEIRHAGGSTPAVNQILLHPYVYRETTELLAYMAAWGITVEAYSVLAPITQHPGGPLDPVLKSLADKYSHTLTEEKQHKHEKHHHHQGGHGHVQVNEGMILFAWARAKGAVIITTSSKRERLEQYLAAGDITLTADDITSIDAAGARFQSWNRQQKFLQAVKWVVPLAVTCAVNYSLFWK